MKTNKSPILPLVPSPEDKDGMTRYMQSVNQFLQDLSLNANADIESVDGSTTSLAARVDALEAHPYMHVRDEKANNTAGGGFTSGAWRTRTLNTQKFNNISGASLASNQITLPAGTYLLYGRAPALQVGYHKCKLYNITDSVDIEIGSNEYASAGATYCMTNSVVTKRIAFNQETVLELQHRCSNTASPGGFGYASNFGVVEVYAELEIWKIA